MKREVALLLSGSNNKVHLTHTQMSVDIVYNPANMTHEAHGNVTKAFEKLKEANPLSALPPEVGTEHPYGERALYDKELVGGLFSIDGHIQWVIDTGKD